MTSEKMPVNLNSSVTSKYSPSLRGESTTPRPSVALSAREGETIKDHVSLDSTPNMLGEAEGLLSDSEGGSSGGFITPRKNESSERQTLSLLSWEKQLRFLNRSIRSNVPRRRDLTIAQNEARLFAKIGSRICPNPSWAWGFGSASKMLAVFKFFKQRVRSGENQNFRIPGSEQEAEVLDLERLAAWLRMSLANLDDWTPLLRMLEEDEPGTITTPWETVPVISRIA